MPEEMLPFNPPPYRGAMAAAFASPGLTEALKDYRTLFGGPTASVLLDGRNRVVAVSLPLGSGRVVPAVVKEFRVRGLKKIIGFARPSKAAKAWGGALALVENGFPTPAPIAYLERRRRGFVAESVFVAEHVSGASEIRDLFRRLSEPDLRALLARLAAVLRRFHDAALVHHDLSDGNVLVRADSGGASEFLFLDTNRIRRRKRLGAFGRARGLVRLGVPPALRTFFLGQYAGAPGASPLGRSFVFWYKAGKFAFASWVRIKKILRLRKIARALRVQ